VLSFRDRKLIKEINRMFDYYETNHYLPKSMYQALLKLENEDHPRAPYTYITHYQGVRLDIQRKKKR